MKVMLICAAIAIVVLAVLFIKERQQRKMLEKNLEQTNRAFRLTLEAIVKSNSIERAETALEAYFKSPVDHTGDGLIDNF